ncbi:hypothetical protein [Amycolatopsis regifaucium]|uniref:Uncharacterized protein n=1 Tax=Amycolatopsis regifaucium TaxID=546365 RepID=A0A154MIY5_9PSEU|nr:hypothetical protein [Amycolatopsis regifaucium]KZB83419.1 hypothetical protein AVL48_04585 [Amycolatopsis regifaucium]OKA08884.1 hypothetical protein ATP06_0211050 [Amycolatopsis regifaucium]SFI90268.1 hypothetical protein SAMN04489731_1144 [Amycolatopsis regifaucium]
MQNWVKYILQTTLATGSLLMLGTGIASAAENVDPDLPASPLDQFVDPAISGLTEAVRQAQPLQQLDTADEDSLQPAVTAAMTDVPAAIPPTTTPAGPIYPVPMGLLHATPLPAGDIADDLQEVDLHKPLGSELSATELPTLPILSRVEQEQGSLPALKPAVPVHGGFAVPATPVSTTVVTDPLDAGSGTRVTAFHTSAPQVATTSDNPASMPEVPVKRGYAQRADKPISSLPLAENGVLGLAVIEQVTNSVGEILRK